MTGPQAGRRNTPRAFLSHVVRRPALAVSLFLSAGIALAAILAVLVLDDLRHRTTLESARSYAAMFTVFRDYYSKVIVGSAKKSGITISPQYHDIEGAIPPPATMTIEISSWMEDLISPGGVRWYSNYPFLSRGSGGPRSTFEKEALQALTSKTVRSFMRVEEPEGDQPQIMRYAKPIHMGKGCVDCHNSHPDSPRTDWKIGDIRGVQVISLAMPPLLPSPSALYDEDRGLFISIAAALAGIGLISMLLLVLLNRLRRAVQTTSNRNRQLLRARQVAEHAAETKTRIMTNFSHELRTP